ncbi:DUF6153 family protein [Streptomyces sp. NPDC006463]|uniref:DUF6153 family protein n=1 Tax=Streptomyces sp. NPDC006463 TaxID=3364746 RepID=UPI0036A47E2B
MISAPQPPRRRPAGPGRLLLVLAVLAGVLAMHGLGAGGMTARAHTTASGAHATAATHEGSGHQAGADCSHTAGGQGFVHHADATCAATGIVTAYAPPALAAALQGASPAGARATRAPASAESGRAPPDLAELQLLRI